MAPKGFFGKIARKKFTHQKILSQHHEAGHHDFILVLDHLKPGYNVAKIFRSANAFSAAEVHLVGIPFFDVRAATGGFKHTRSKSFDTFAESYKHLKEQGYTLYALAGDAASPLSASELEKKAAFVIGHEEFGLSFKPEEYSDIEYISIPQFGQVQSLNAAVAASIASYEYLRQHVLTQDAWIP